MKKMILITLLCTLLTNCKGEDYHNLGVFEEKQGNPEKAIYYYTKAIEQNPNDFDTYFDRAHLQQTMGGKVENVIADYSEFLKHNANDYEAFMDRGVAYVRARQYTEAIADYKKSIELNPEYALAYANLGNVYKLQNDTENACLNWKKALSLGNKDVAVLITLNCK